MSRAERIIELRERYRATATQLGSVNALQIVELVCENPIVTTRLVEARLGVARPTALRLLRQLQAVGVLDEAAQGPRGQRRYVARDLMDVVTADEFGGALLASDGRRRSATANTAAWVHITNNALSGPVP